MSTFINLHPSVCKNATINDNFLRTDFAMRIQRQSNTPKDNQISRFSIGLFNFSIFDYAEFNDINIKIMAFWSIFLFVSKTKKAARKKLRFWSKFYGCIQIFTEKSCVKKVAQFLFCVFYGSVVSIIV